MLLVAACLVAHPGHAGTGDEFFLEGFESPVAETTGFRITDLELRDPHIFVEFLVSCPGVTNEFNNAIADELNLDSNEDGNLDLSIVLGMRPLDQGGGIANLDMFLANCTFPPGGTSCVPFDTDPLLATTTYQAEEDPICLDVIPGTTGSYVPPATPSTVPCFDSQAVDLSLPILGTSLALLDVHLGATFVGEPATQMVNGLLYGFLTESEAESTFLPEGIPLVGGQPLSAVLPGGEGNCSSNDDRDEHEAQVGWWLYFNFEALAVPFTP